MQDPHQFLALFILILHFFDMRMYVCMYVRMYVLEFQRQQWEGRKEGEERG